MKRQGSAAVGNSFPLVFFSSPRYGDAKAASKHCRPQNDLIFPCWLPLGRVKEGNSSLVAQGFTDVAHFFTFSSTPFPDAQRESSVIPK